MISLADHWFVEFLSQCKSTELAVRWRFCFSFFFIFFYFIVMSADHIINFLTVLSYRVTYFIILQWKRRRCVKSWCEKMFVNVTLIKITYPSLHTYTVVVWLQSGLIDKRRLMLLLKLFYKKMNREVKKSLAHPKRCTYSALSNLLSSSFVCHYHHCNVTSQVCLINWLHYDITKRCFCFWIILSGS